MTGQASPESRAAGRRTGALTLIATVLTLAGVVVAVVNPPWLTGPLLATVQSVGWAAPVVYVTLCALTAPLHLTGVLVTLSTVIWPLPEALTLSFVGSVLGSLGTAALLARIGGVALRQRGNWPGWLLRLSGQVERRPVLIGVIARLAMNTGLAVEAFYLLTGYRRTQYLLATLLGLALWVTQTLVGLTLLRMLAQYSSGLAALAALVPLLMIGAFMTVRRRREA